LGFGNPNRAGHGLLKIIKPKFEVTTVLSRRKFFRSTGWAIFTAAVGLAFGPGLIRYLYPRVLFEPSAIFKAGFPDEYPPGTVSEKWKKNPFRTWIVRREDGEFYALFARCTHLGCTPRWLGSENKFKCPCHGSGFDRDGINYEGPAPRPLERVKITRAEDGQILIDKSVTFTKQEDWDKPGSSLRV
jgi:cytochrome b6-f complex iron-sulfur subunit